MDHVHATGVSLCNYINCDICFMVFVKVVVVRQCLVIVELIMSYMFLAVELLCRTLDRKVFVSYQADSSNCVLDTKPMEVIFGCNSHHYCRANVETAC